MSLFLPFRKSYSGFTLAELLIALAILGMIATFTIPKILTAQQDSKKYAVFKETISLVSSLAYAAQQSGDNTYFPNHINAVKNCPTNASVQGCFSATYTGPGGENTQNGFLLHNGASVAGFGSYTYSNGIAIDWNGLEPPNVYGDDQLHLDICFDQGSGCIADFGTAMAGKVRPDDTTSVALYQTIFSN